MGQSWHAQCKSTRTIVFLYRAPNVLQEDIEKRIISRVDQCRSQKVGKRLMYHVLRAGRADRQSADEHACDYLQESQGRKVLEYPLWQSGKVVVFERPLGGAGSRRGKQ